MQGTFSQAPDPYATLLPNGTYVVVPFSAQNPYVSKWQRSHLADASAAAGLPSGGAAFGGGHNSVVFDAFQSAANALELPDAWIDAFGSATWALFGNLALSFEGLLRGISPSAVDTMAEWVEANAYQTRSPLPLHHRPTDAILCVVMYFISLGVLYGVSRALGKRTCRGLGLVHNAFLFVLSLYMGVAILVTAVVSFSRPWNIPVLCPKDDDNGWRMTKLMWLFAVSKLAEYGDTFLMILKHNYHQLSFLHLYHHSSIFVWCLFASMIAPGGDSYWSSMVNCWVHVFMYGYYAGTLAFRDGPIRRALNSIKFIITKGQITQFVANMAQAFYSFSQPVLHYQVYMYVIQSTYMLSMVVLFSNFLLRNRSNPDRRNRKARAPTTAAKQHATTTAAAAEAAIVNSSVVSPLALSPAPLDVQHVAKRAASFNAMPSPSCSSSPGISPSLSRDETISSIPTPTSVSLLNGNEQ